ncbi:unnamed protein product [Boreogadus saida]
MYFKTEMGQQPQQEGQGPEEVTEPEMVLGVSVRCEFLTTDLRVGVCWSFWAQGKSSRVSASFGACVLVCVFMRQT